MKARRLVAVAALWCVLTFGCGLLTGCRPDADVSTPPELHIALAREHPAIGHIPRTQYVGGAVSGVLYVRREPYLDLTCLRSASVLRHGFEGGVQLRLQFNEKGRARLAKLTGEHVGERLALVIDGRLYSSPTIREQIPGDAVSFTGSFDAEEAHFLARRLDQAARRLEED